MAHPIRHDPQQAALLARIIVVKFGADAPHVAAERARLWVEAGDQVTASLWTEVSRHAAARLARDPTRGSEPSLTEILDGAVTRQVMAADKVSRSEAERMLGRVRERFRRK